MQLNLILLGSSILVLTILAIYFFYWQRTKRKGQLLLDLSKRIDWAEPMLATNKREQLEENIVDEIMSPILPKPQNKPQATRETQLAYDYDVLTLYIMPTKNRFFQGYELLQAISVNSFNYGKMRIFHRHEQTNNPESPILFSLASAIEPGFFNLSEMGSVNCTGLILFMKVEQRNTDDLTKNFYLMLDTAHQLADDLGGEVCDETRNLFDISSEKRYLKRLGNNTVLT